MKYDNILEDLEAMAEIQAEAMKVSLGECRICCLPVTQWDAEFTDMGSHYVGNSIYHGSCFDGRMPVSG
jgi:hypothetical protein